MLWICLHIASIYSTTLFYIIAVLQKESVCRSPRKRKVLRINVSMSGTRNGIRLQISWWMWLVSAVLPALLKLLKELENKQLSKAIEYRNTNRICVDYLQSSLIKRNFTALLRESGLLRLQNKVRFLAKINEIFLQKSTIYVYLLNCHYQSSNESNLSFENNVIMIVPFPSF